MILPGDERSRKQSERVPPAIALAVSNCRLETCYFVDTILLPLLLTHDPDLQQPKHSLQPDHFAQVMPP